jgi:two-component system response regulator AlgR
LIADDEAPARARLAALLAGCGADCQLIAEAANGAEVLARCAQYPVAAAPKPPAVIFVTAYDEHALAAFEANAIDYLLKPVRPERLRRALDKARALSREQRMALLGADSFVNASYRGGILRVAVGEVILLRADSKYVEVWHAHGMALTEESLRAIEERLPGMFLRVHRNALVAQDRVRALVKGSEGQPLLQLQGTDVLVEVSRRHAAEVRRLLRSPE